MTKLRATLLEAVEAGRFLEAIFSELQARDARPVLVAEVVSMHNEGLLDAVSQFARLSRGCTEVDFFLTRQVLIDALPRLNAPVSPVIECITHLIKEAGADLAAHWLICPFVDFLAADPSRPKEALTYVQAFRAHIDLLTPVAIAWARCDFNQAFREAVRLVKHSDIEVRRRAVFSLGKIEYPDDHACLNRTLSVLETSLRGENDDRLLAGIVLSAFALFRMARKQEDRVCRLVNGALTKGSDVALHAASELLGMHTDVIPDNMLDITLAHLLNVRPENVGTLKRVDWGLAQLVKTARGVKAMEFLEAFLIRHDSALSLDQFPDF